VIVGRGERFGVRWGVRSVERGGEWSVVSG